MKILPTLIALLFINAAQADEYGSYRAEIVRVIDGDTIEVRAHIWPGLTQTVKLRLAGINTPESKGKGISACEKKAGQGKVHQDVEERMKELNRKLEAFSLRRYLNSIIIKCDNSSSIVAVAFGTVYSIKIGSLFKHAINSGAKTSHQWSDGTSLDLIELFGHDWIVGTWENNETYWIRSGSA